MRRAARLSRCVWRGFGRAEALLDRVRALPEASASALLGDGPALVLAPHPDDESLGCGGLIAQAAAAGTEVHVLVVTDGAALATETEMRTSIGIRRRAEALAAMSVLGLPPAQVAFWALPDGSAPRTGRAARAVADRAAALVRRLGVQTILAPWEFDDHPDHVAVFGYGRRAARSTGAALFAYPVWAWMLPGRMVVPRTQPLGCTVDIRGTLDIKRRAVFQHASQIAALRPAGSEGFALNDEHLRRLITPYEAYIACNRAAYRRLSANRPTTAGRH